MYMYLVPNVYMCTVKAMFCVCICIYCVPAFIYKYSIAGWSGRSLGAHWSCAWCRYIPGMVHVVCLHTTCTIHVQYALCIVCVYIVYVTLLDMRIYGVCRAFASVVMYMYTCMLLHLVRKSNINLLH